MKAIVIEQYGGKEQLKELEVERPRAPKDGVVIEMYGTSINPIDWKLREGYLKGMMAFEFPIILGWDAAGVITEIGSKVTKYKVGDRVFARPETTAKGTYAEFVATEEHLLAKIPDNISFEEAASIPLAGLTAWQCLVDIGKLKQGEKVLIHAGAGGVGSLAIQIAKNIGAYVATTGSGKNEEFLKSLGADLVIDYSKYNFEEQIKDYDLVVDTMGGEIQTKSYKVIKDGGRLVSIVAQPDEKVASEYGVTAIFHWLKPNGEELGILAELMEKGKLKPIVGHIFDLSQEGLRAAHLLSESHHAKGKIVIKIK